MLIKYEAKERKLTGQSDLLHDTLWLDWPIVYYSTLQWGRIMIIVVVIVIIIIFDYVHACN